MCSLKRIVRRVWTKLKNSNIYYQIVRNKGTNESRKSFVPFDLSIMFYIYRQIYLKDFYYHKNYHKILSLNSFYRIYFNYTFYILLYSTLIANFMSGNTRNRTMFKRHGQVDYFINRGNESLGFQKVWKRLVNKIFTIFFFKCSTGFSTKVKIYLKEIYI